MPTPLLKNNSPFAVLFNSQPDYSSLRVFGCACWPNLRPYTSNKLQPRSMECIFLGCSPIHKGYKCYHVSSSRIYISRDVVFNENHFPYTVVSNSNSTSISNLDNSESHSMITYGPRTAASLLPKPLHMSTLHNNLHQHKVMNHHVSTNHNPYPPNHQLLYHNQLLHLLDKIHMSLIP